MTRYVINPYQTVELPTFNPRWRELCDRCVSSAFFVHGNSKSRLEIMRCDAAKPGMQGKPTCSEARHTVCANGELFRERVL